jgi:hypothetical protein
MKERREKVEEIKKKTNYYTTRDLLQKYDESAPSETPLRRRNPALPPPSQLATPQQSQFRPIPGPNTQTPAPTKPLDPRLTGTEDTLSPKIIPDIPPPALSPPSYSIAPPHKQWYDKLADALLGDDDATFASPSSRYALICEKCFTHNGLVKESMWEDARMSLLLVIEIVTDCLPLSRVYLSEMRTF